MVGNPDTPDDSGVAEASISAVLIPDAFAVFLASSHAGLFASQWGQPSMKNNTRTGCLRIFSASFFRFAPRRTADDIYVESKKMASLDELRNHKNLGPNIPPTPHYTDYTQSLEKNTAPGGAITTPTGFLEFKPRDSVTQAKYDAMQPSWQGAKESEAAIAKGSYLPDYAGDAKERGLNRAGKNALVQEPAQEPAQKKGWLWFLS
jgi:hypothetical protein